MWFLVPSALFQAKLANLKSINQEGRQDLKHLKLLVPVTRCFFEDLLKHHTLDERPAHAIAWTGQHAQNIQQAIELGFLDAADWHNFFPKEQMDAHASEAVRNFSKYQLKKNV